MKNKSNAVDFVTGILNAASITFILNTPGFPPLFIGGAVCSSLQFVIQRGLEKLKWVEKYNSYLVTSNQYKNLSAEILTVLTKNNLTNEQYESYLEEVIDKQSLIRDTEIV